MSNRCQGSFQRAVDTYRQALRLAVEAGDSSIEIHAEVGLAAAYSRLDQHEEALHHGLSP